MHNVHPNKILLKHICLLTNADNQIQLIIFFIAERKHTLVLKCIDLMEAIEKHDVSIYLLFTEIIMKEKLVSSPL